MSTDKSVSFPVRMPTQLAEKLKLATQLTGLSQQDMARLAIQIGLEDLSRCNWDIASAIVDAAKGQQQTKPEPQANIPGSIITLPLAAEPPTRYKVPRKKPAG